MPDDLAYMESHARKRRTAEPEQVEDSARKAHHDESAPQHSNALLGDSRLGSRGNGVVRTEAIRQAQQTHGNRAVQRMLQNAAILPVQRDDDKTSTLPAVPNVTLNTPSLLQPPGSASRHNFGTSQLQMDPQILAMAQQYAQQQTNPATLISSISSIKLGPLPAVQTGALSPLPAAPAQSSSSTAAPANSGGDQPAAPHPGGPSDIMDAVLTMPEIKSTVTSLQTSVTERIGRDWRRMSTGEQIGTVSVVAAIAAGALGGALSDPNSRSLVLGQLNGKMIPVPGVDWLHLEANVQGDNLMLGFHADVGALLPKSWGFGPGSPAAIGGPPGAAGGQ